MMGLDIIGPLLVLVAIALMSVVPLQLTIARSRTKAAWVAAMARDDGDASPPAPDREAAAAEVPAAFAGGSVRPAQARNRTAPGLFEII